MPASARTRLFIAAFCLLILSIFCILTPASALPLPPSSPTAAGYQAPGEPGSAQTSGVQETKEPGSAEASGPQQTQEPVSAEAGPQKADDQGRTRLPMLVRKSVSFREIGPAISGGRVPAVAGVPHNPDLYYVGTAAGGVFRTRDGGITWKALFQHESVASIGALAVDPQNSEILWAGTGEANVRNQVSFGNGVYKSTDGGDHWQHLGLDHSSQISRIVIDPHRPDTVLVAAMGNPWADNEERGVFRTTDGGATWKKVLYLGPGVGIADLAVTAQNPQVLYAAAYRYRRSPWSYSGGGPEDAIYKSTDQGQTWKRLTGHGLPTGPVGRIGLAVAPSAPSTVYATIESKDGVLWRSDDGGEHWQMVSDDQEVNVRPFYFSSLAVDPRSPEHIFALSNELMESKDGGQHFTPIARHIHGDHHAIWIDPEGTGRMIDGNDGGIALSRDNGEHWAFLHNVAIAQFYHLSADDRLPYMVCGGLQDNSAWCGPSRSKDRSGILDRDWFDLNGGDGMYAIEAADDPNLIYNSTQNQALMVFDRLAQQVHDIEPYPRDMVGGGVAEEKYRFAWNAGFAVSPQDPKTIYAGGNVLFKSEDRGRTWKPISPDLTRNDKSKQQASGGPVIKDNSGAEVYDAIIRITPSSRDAKVLWVGTDDGKVQFTRDGGGSWTDVTPHIPGLEPWGRVESIDVSPNDDGDAVIAVDRHYNGDFKPYVYHTTDWGATWRSIAGNLPQVYAHVAYRDRRNPHMYYAGLENGLYVSWNDGAQWYLFGLGLPNTPVYDLAYQAKENDLVVATHGRGVWILDDLTPFQQSSATAQGSFHLFPVPSAFRFWPWSQVEELGDAAFYGKNPPYGAQISYFLAHKVNEPGQLVITDSKGRVVRTMKGMHTLEPGEKPPEEEEATEAQKSVAQAQQPQRTEALAEHPAPSTQTQQQVTKAAAGAEAEPGKPKEVPWIPTEPGLQRAYWDLRADGPVRWESAKGHLKGPQSGAVLPPGEYTATMTVGGVTAKERFTVVNDPTSKATQADLEANYQFTQGILHQVSQLDTALNRLDAITGQVNALETAAKNGQEEAAVKSAIANFKQQIKQVLEHITSNPQAGESILRMRGKIREHLFALSGSLQGSDDPPTAAMQEQRQALEPEYKTAIEAFNQFQQSEVPAFNSKMEQLKMTGVVAGKALEP